MSTCITTKSDCIKTLTWETRISNAIKVFNFVVLNGIGRSPNNFLLGIYPTTFKPSKKFPMSSWSSNLFMRYSLANIRNYFRNLFNDKCKVIFFLKKVFFPDKFSHSSMEEGVNAWIICLPSGAKDESRRVDRDKNYTSFIL